MTIDEWKDASPQASESVEQQRLFQWAAGMSLVYPELKSMYHIPNEGKRKHTTGARLKSMGLRRGVPDICLPVGRCGCHALYVEMKRLKDGRPTAEQLEWIDTLTAQGNMAVVCHGWEMAAELIERYLGGRL